jgi:hypothetical protein
MGEPAYAADPEAGPAAGHGGAGLPDGTTCWWATVAAQQPQAARRRGGVRARAARAGARGAAAEPLRRSRRWPSSAIRN